VTLVASKEVSFMDTIVNIFVSLGVQKIIVVQFASVVVFYFLLTKIFFSKLQFVIETREAQTTKREGSANQMFAKAEALAADYKKSIDQAQSENFELLAKKKSAYLENQKNELKKKNQEVDASLEVARKESMKKIDSQKSQIMAQADELSKQLVDRFNK
jgi:F0F1-type ATP synthase membrane subunit b/b'